MTTAVKTEAPHHRSLYCVKQFNCHRPECVARSNAYNRTRYRKVGYGSWQPLVDAAGARQHIEDLRASGASTNAIADAAHVSRATLARVVYGLPAGRPTEKIRKESAEALLAVRLEDCRIPAGALIDGTGTRRRIQALVAMGWSFTALGPRIGIHPRPLGDLARATRVTAATAHKVRIAYRQLASLPPETARVPSQARALARKVAERGAWHGPLAWGDDIDDPKAQPEIDAPAADGKTRPEPVDAARVQRLTAEGLTAQQIAERLGCHKRTVVRARTRSQNQMATAA